MALVTGSEVPSLAEFTRDLAMRAARVDAILFGESPLATQRKERKLYHLRLIVIIVGAATVWLLLSLTVSSTVAIAGWLFWAAVAFAIFAEARHHREINFIPNGQLISDNENAFLYGLIGAFIGAVAAHLIGVERGDGAVGGTFAGTVYGLADAVSTRYQPTQKLIEAQRRPWRQQLERVAFAVIQAVAVGVIVGVFGGLLTPNHGMTWFLGSCFAMFRICLGKGGLTIEYKADWADALGAFVWGGMVGLATLQFTLLKEPAEHWIVWVIFSIVIPVAVGWVAAWVAIDSGVPLGVGKARTRLGRAILLGLLSSLISLGLMSLGDWLFDEWALMAAPSLLVSVFVGVWTGRRMFGANKSGRSAQLPEIVFGMTGRLGSLWRGALIGKVGGGFLRR